MLVTELDSLWVRRYHPAPAAKVRLVCLPHAGGSASFFFPVSAALSPQIDVIAMQYPGRQDRRHEPLIDDLTVLARKVFEVLKPANDKPLALFGHSMGATLAYEVARLFEQETGESPVHLFASGRRAPSQPRHETVHQLDDDGLLADVRKLSGTDGRILDDVELLRLALPAIRADYRAAETYVYSPGSDLRCPITAFTGDNDPKATVDEVRAWATHTTGEFDVTVFPGGHFFLAQHQRAILDIISRRLAI